MENKGDMIKEIATKEFDPLHGGELIIVSGPSGSGKSAIAERLLTEDSGLQRIISTTTRTQRVSETGNEYKFVKKEEMTEEMLAHLVAKNEYGAGQDIYGTDRQEIEDVFSGSRKIWNIDLSQIPKLDAILEKAVGKDRAAELLSRTKVIVIGVKNLGELNDRFLDRQGLTGANQESIMQGKTEITRRIGEDIRAMQQIAEKHMPFVELDPEKPEEAARNLAWARDTEERTGKPVIHLVINEDGNLNKAAEIVEKIIKNN